MFSGTLQPAAPIPPTTISILATFARKQSGIFTDLMASVSFGASSRLVALNCARAVRCTVTDGFGAAQGRQLGTALLFRTGDCRRQPPVVAGVRRSRDGY